MVLKAGAPAGLGAGHHEHRPLQHREHVPVQHRAHGAALFLFVPEADAPGVQEGPVPFREHRRVELGIVPGLLPQEGPVRIMDVAVILVLPGGSIAHRHGDDVLVVQHVVEVIPSVRPSGHVRGVQALLPAPVVRVLGLPVDHALVPPVRQVLLRGGPADVVLQAVDPAAELVMGTVDVDPPAEPMRLPVRDILPGGEIGVAQGFLLRHGFHSLFRFFDYTIFRGEGKRGQGGSPALLLFPGPRQRDPNDQVRRKTAWLSHFCLLDHLIR